MITLRRMTGDEYRQFREYSIADYAKDLAESGGLDGEQAHILARKEFDETLPEGPETSDQYLMTIEDAESGADAGRIWYSYEEDDGARQVFLSDLVIFTEERRKGYAKAALREMERAAKADGCTVSLLFVWDHNGPGIRLYVDCGYKACGRGEGGSYMKKVL